MAHARLDPGLDRVPWPALNHPMQHLLTGRSARTFAAKGRKRRTTVACVRPILLMGLALAAMLGCSDGTDESFACRGNDCVCTDQDRCTLECGSGCDADCQGFDDCNVACGDDCNYRCESGDRCELNCGDDCLADCRSIDQCLVETGNRGVYSCFSANACTVQLGDDSVARCESVSSCNVTCGGRCTVTCISLSACNVSCLVGERVDCGDGVVVCGLECPAPQ